MCIATLNSDRDVHQGPHTAITGGGERRNDKDTSEPSWLGGISSSMRLFFYRDFLPVLEGEYYLVIVDRDPGEQPSDVAFIEGDQRSGQALEEGGNLLDFICPLGL